LESNQINQFNKYEISFAKINADRWHQRPDGLIRQVKGFNPHEESIKDSINNGLASAEVDTDHEDVSDQTVRLDPHEESIKDSIDNGLASAEVDTDHEEVSDQTVRLVSPPPLLPEDDLPAKQMCGILLQIQGSQNKDVAKQCSEK